MAVWDVTAVCQKRCDAHSCQKDEICFRNLVCLKVPVSPGVSPSPPILAPVSAPAQSSKGIQMWMIVGGGVSVGFLLIIILVYFAF